MGRTSQALWELEDIILVTGSCGTLGKSLDSLNFISQVFKTKSVGQITSKTDDFPIILTGIGVDDLEDLSIKMGLV